MKRRRATSSPSRKGLADRPHGLPGGLEPWLVLSGLLFTAYVYVRSLAWGWDSVTWTWYDAIALLVYALINFVLAVRGTRC